MPLPCDKNISPECWLEQKVKQYEESSCKLQVPLKDDGTEYAVRDLYDDQKAIVAEVMSTVQTWLKCSDLTTFKPLRLTLNGAGGTGKSVIINTLVTLMRKMFQTNDVTRVIAPTGTAAFNVGGETFHHLLHNTVTKTQYNNGSMQTEKKKRLIKKFKSLLMLIIDERSLVSCKDLGTAETMIKETIYDGAALDHESWGALPVLILVGDDYQLPATVDPAFQAMDHKYKGPMVNAGRAAFLEAGRNVRKLTLVKRMQDDKTFDKELLENLRHAGNLTVDQVSKLMALHLDEVSKHISREELMNIKRNAIYLFYTNEKRKRHNLQQLALQSNKENPVAVLQPNHFGNLRAKGDRRHFDSDAPETLLLCLLAKVCLSNKNFCPVWGLHNGACGTVQEIIFPEGKSPNNKDLPLYVVVHFPLYCGPVWDANRPKVCSISSFLCFNTFKLSPIKYSFLSVCQFLSLNTTAS